MKFYLFIIIFVMPYILVYSPGIPRWLGRTAATSLLVFLITVCIFWFAISPKSKVIGDSGKFSEPQFAKVRPKIERGIRMTAVAFGILLCLTKTFPLAADLARLTVDRKPTKLRGMVLDRSTPFLGVLLLAGSVRLSRKESSYYLLYSRKQPRVGESYEFVVLPRSRFI